MLLGYSHWHCHFFYFTEMIFAVFCWWRRDSWSAHTFSTFSVILSGPVFFVFPNLRTWLIYCCNCIESLGSGVWKWLKERDWVLLWFSQCLVQFLCQWGCRIHGCCVVATVRYPPFPPTITSIQIASTGPDLSPTECVWDVMEWRFTYHLTYVHF